MIINLKGSPVLKREIQTWVEEGTISPEQADILFRRYALDQEAPWYLRSGFVLKAVAVLLMGMGLFLVLSENWHHFSLVARFAVGMVPLLGVYGLGLWLAAHRKEEAAELTFFLATLGFGVNIFLQAQVFHLSSYYPNGVLWWAIGALPVAVFFRSNLLGLLVQVLFAGWVLMQLQYNQFSLWGPVLYLGLLWLTRLHPNPFQSALLLLNTGLLVFTLHDAVYPESPPDRLLVLGSLAFVVLQVLDGVGRRYPTVPVALFAKLAFGVVFGLAYLASFPDFLGTLLGRGTSAFTFVLFGLGVYLAVRSKARGLHAWVLLLLGLLIALQTAGFLLPRVSVYDLARVGAVLVNMALLAHIAWRVGYGLQVRDKGLFMSGVFFLLLLAMSRYLDFFGNYLAAALIFMLCGGILLLVNHFWNKRYEA